jgi:uncharacterized protein YndB with AHSA1/START domain
VNRQKFVYVTYIASTPEAVWNALRESELTRQYWGHENVSDWKPGSPWRHLANDDQRTTRIVGEVLESVPQRRLVLSWAEPADAAERAKHSRVAIDIEKISDMVRLTVTHDELDPDMLGQIANGWPRVLCSLKSLLETGKALDTWAA